jgi:membrane-bound serine protease (ClpP class)
MAPGTNTGAAHPVILPLFGMQDGGPSEEMVDKATSDLAAMMRAFAEHRGRNAELAVKAVTESLSFTAEEALESDLIEIVAPSLDRLLDELDGTEISRFDGSTVTLDLAQRTLVLLEPTPKERLQSLFANPVLAFFLFAIAAIGIYTEITHPGAVLPGVVGVIALLLFLYSTSVLPVNWIGLALILVALALFILEVKVTSYGFLTLGGLICFVLGSLMLFDAPIPDMRLSLGVVLPTALVVAAVMIFLLQRVLTAHRKRPVTGSEGLVGEIGQAVSELAPAGKVKVHGEWWDAHTAGPAIAAGTEVRVLTIRGRQIEVEAASEPEGES